MLPEQQTMPLSEFSKLYDILVPKDHFLRQMNDLVDFSFVEDELKINYCLDNGRKAEPPVRMFKYLLLKQIHNVSDIDLVERAKYDMSFKYFLGLAPEASVIDPSSLSYFRRLRLKSIDLLNLLVERTVVIALEHGIIKSKKLIVDSTHTISRFKAKSAQEYVQEKSKLLRKTAYKYDASLKEKFPAKPTTNSLEDELTYTKAVIDIIKNVDTIKALPAVKEKINLMEEVIEDIKHEVNFSSDPDARKGYKSEDHSFVGYKTHIAISDERIITAAVVTSGEKSDTKYLEELIETSQENGVDVETVIGDMAYSSKDNLVYTTGKNMKLISRLHPVITNGKRNEETTFEFNKDADMYVCPAGHLATKKKVKYRKVTNQNTQIQYFFDVEKCKVCPLRENCYKEGSKTKSYSISIKSNEHLAHEAFQETEEFKQLSKDRYKIEAKNSELKNRHGYAKAHSAGLLGMNIQGATTIFVANMKRIIKLINEK